MNLLLKIIRHAFLPLLCLLISTSSFGQDVKIKNLKTSDTLAVGVAGSAPFYFTDENSNVPQGISVKIWENIADNKQWNFKYKNFNSVNDALKSLKEGNLDVVVGPITINSERLEHFRFSQPFYQSSLAIVYSKGGFSFWNLMKLLFSYRLLIAIAVFLIILTFVGTLLWLAERKASPDQFSHEPAKGIGTGMWLAIVTMSTTGYGDKAPITLAGRIIAGTWMIVSIISATSMVAGIASVLTFSNLQTADINSIEQLKGKKVATISGSPSTDFLKEYNIKILSVTNLSDAFKKLKNKDIEAIVYDRPQLMYYMKDHEDEKYAITKAEYYQQGYGFAFPENSQLIYEVNRTLLELSEDQETNEIIEGFLEKSVE